MSAEESRRIALQWIECIAENRLDDLTALVAPDATWWVSGQKETAPSARTRPYADVEKRMKEMYKDKKSSAFTTRGVTTEGDTVVIEGSHRFEFQDDRVYENDLMIKFVIKDGKIQSLREYIDRSVFDEFRAAKKN